MTAQRSPLDSIHLEGIKVKSQIGVPPEERISPQELEISLTLFLPLHQAAQKDELQKTIDYASIHQKTLQIAQQRPRLLIETLAEELAHAILREFRPLQVEVEIRKFILPETRFVSVRISRRRRKSF